MADDKFVYERPEKPQQVQERPCHFMSYLRERYDLPKGWRWVSWELKNFGTPHEVTMVEGAVCPDKTRGKNKGRMNWAKRDQSTQMTLPVPLADYRVWEERWERETGYCRHCEGTGYRWRGWSADDGHTYKLCRHCDATGKAVIEEAA